MNISRRGDALEYLDDAAQEEFWMGSAEKVNMILVHSDRLCLHLVSLLDAYASFSDYPDDLFIEERPQRTYRSRATFSVPRTHLAQTISMAAL